MLTHSAKFYLGFLGISSSSRVSDQIQSPHLSYKVTQTSRVLVSCPRPKINNKVRVRTEANALPGLSHNLSDGSTR